MEKDPKVTGPKEENKEQKLTKEEVFEELDKMSLGPDGLGENMETCCDTGLL